MTDDVRILRAVIAHPWLGVAPLAGHLGLPRRTLRPVLERLCAEGYLQRIPHGDATATPDDGYAPNAVALQCCAAQAGMTAGALLARLGVCAERYWMQRLCREIGALLGLLVGNLRRSVPGAALTCETFLLRRMQGQPLALHARLTWPAHTRHVLVDQGGESIWMWWRHFRYLGALARRNPQACPPLLLISTRDFRCGALLTLARQICPALRVMATADRDTLLQGDPRVARWLALSPADGTPLRVDPFVGLRAGALPADAGAVSDHNQTARMRTRTRAQRSALQAPDFSLSDPPPALARLPAIESLTAEERAVLTFLSRHPVCTAELLARVLDQPLQRVNQALDRLVAQGLAERDVCREGVAPGGSGVAVTCVSASADAVRLLAGMCGSAADGDIVRRHARAVSNHRRRLQHSLDVLEVFARLSEHARGWSAVLRRIDAPLRAPNAGAIPHLALEVIEEDLHAAAHFAVAGVRRKWLPDGYGVLRAGDRWHPFWLEVDGTRRTRSRVDAEAWQGKLDAVCAYIATGKWRMRHRSLPLLLVVTQDLRTHPLICDALGAAARAQDVREPEVFVAGWPALEQRGPLAPIWLGAHATALPGFQHAFPQLPTLRDSALESAPDSGVAQPTGRTS